MPTSNNRHLDIEAAAPAGGPSSSLNDRLLPPSSQSPEKHAETPPEQQLRWGFIRKIYTILSLQMLLTVAISATVIFFAPVARFAYTPAGITVLAFFIILLVMVLIPLHYYRKHKPYNLILLGVFTVSISFAVGFACAFIDGKVILESAAITTMVLVSLNIYTFWAVSKGQDFSFLGTYLFSAAMILLSFLVIQMFLPLGKITTAIYGGLASLVFSAYIIYDTAKVTQAYDTEDYAWVAVMLYLDVVNLFLSLTTLFKASAKD